MDIRSDEFISPDPENDIDAFFSGPTITCPNCLAMMNEII